VTILAIETSCDETSTAVVRDGCILSNVVSSQIKLHAEYGGVVPELATREHLRNFIPVSRATLDQARITMVEVDAFAATQGPGLPNALMIGFKAAQALAFALDRPFVGVNHHEAHLYSPWIIGSPKRADFTTFEPNVSLIVSGGHTMLVHVTGELRHELLGSTLDDAAGECFDKVGKLMGFAYPAGPVIDKLAGEGTARFNFPRPMLSDSSDDFSFSGLKTAVRYFLDKHPELLQTTEGMRDLSASVQTAIVEVLVTKTVRAARRVGVRCVTASGGVVCNSALRQELTRACAANGLRLQLAEKDLCTDNAGMIGVLAERKLLANKTTTPYDEEILPSWSLETAEHSLSFVTR
jgi:N6-L-threonylcarbamoyladenine synthase